MNTPKPLDKVDEIRGELEDLIERIPRSPELPPDPSDVKIIFVAVHGIGDQFRFETIQSVSYAVCRYVGQPAAIPLGRYHGKSVGVSGAYVPTSGIDPEVRCGFAEMYWADVPRESVDDKFTLEESRKWARNLVARLDLLARRAMQKSHQESGAASAELQQTVEKWRKENRHENDLIENILEEVIQGVTIADRLAFLAEKAGLFKFELKKLLLDYVDDIQVVTEFQGSRDRLVAKFRELMTKIHKNYEGARIYVVAHSEGTVVGFLGLLEGIRAAEPWTKSVHGLMTIGSPLNKHVKLWPELFHDPVDRDGAPLPGPGPDGRIPWRNYHDHGDPIGFDLQLTRDWMAEHGWGPFFEFDGGSGGHDIGFTRYPFPGAAHNGYWNDEKVFGHFLATVVDPEAEILKPADKNAPAATAAAPATPATQAKKRDEYWRPTDDLIAKLTSYVLPYVAAALLLLIGVFVLYKAIRGFLMPQESQVETSAQVAANVFGLVSLIAGMSLLARIPRLTHYASIAEIGRGEREALATLGWRVIACLLALLSLGYLAVSEANRESIERLITRPIIAWYPPAMTAEGWYGARSFEGAMLVALVALLALTPTLLSNRSRPAARVVVPALIVLMALRVAWPLMRPALPLDAWGDWVPAVTIGLAAVFLAASYLIEGRVTVVGSVAVVGAVVALLWLHVRGHLDPTGASVRTSSLAFIVLTWCIGVLAWLVGRRYPRVGARPLVHTGGLFLLILIGSWLVEGWLPPPDRDGPTEARQAAEERPGRATVAPAAPFAGAPRGAVAAPDPRLTVDSQRGPLLPVAAAAAAFLYLWWLAIMAFDLTFIWHLYVRHNGARHYVKAMIARAAKMEAPVRSPPSSGQSSRPQQGVPT